MEIISQVELYGKNHTAESKEFDIIKYLLLIFPILFILLIFYQSC